MTSESLAGLISITNPTDTRILKITVTTTNAELSRDIANTLVSVSLDYLPKTMGTEQPNVAQEARVAVHKSRSKLSEIHRDRCIIRSNFVLWVLYCEISYG